MSSAPQLEIEELSVIDLGDGRSLRLGEVVGRGGSATVYRALLSSGDRFRRAVAAKVFDVFSSEEFDNVRDALARAARKAACVHHPNVVAPLEFVVHEGRLIIVSEFVDGISLASFQDAYQEVGRKMPPDLALFIALEIAEGLAGARDARTPEGALLNMRHHDLSPSEVVISWHGEVKVTDFGVSAALRSSSGVTTLSGIARRCATFAPEIIAGSRGDARSDVFSLGIILRQMLVGPRFTRDTNDAERISLARDGDIPIGLMESPIAEPLASILARALALEPSHRYPDASRFAFDLRRAALSMGVGDGRVFLRSALREVLAVRSTAEDTSDREYPTRARSKVESGEVATITSVMSDEPPPTDLRVG